MLSPLMHPAWPPGFTLAGDAAPSPTSPGSCLLKQEQFLIQGALPARALSTQGPAQGWLTDPAGFHTEEERESIHAAEENSRTAVTAVTQLGHEHPAKCAWTGFSLVQGRQTLGSANPLGGSLGTARACTRRPLLQEGGGPCTSEGLDLSDR